MLAPLGSYLGIKARTRVRYPDDISHCSSQAINALGSVTQVRLYIAKLAIPLARLITVPDKFFEFIPG
jgi:hypothetical protein